MIYHNCLFCKVRGTVTKERVQASLANSNLELLVLDGTNALARFKSNLDESKLSSITNKLMNSMLFNSVRFSRQAYVGKG